MCFQVYYGSDYECVTAYLQPRSSGLAAQAEHRLLHLVRVRVGVGVRVTVRVRVRVRVKVGG